MKIYAYVGEFELGKEPCGTSGKIMFEMNAKWAILRRCRQAFKDKPFRVFSYSNFFDNETFREISH